MFDQSQLQRLGPGDKMVMTYQKSQKPPSWLDQQNPNRTTPPSPPPPPPTGITGVPSPFPPPLVPTMAPQPLVPGSAPEDPAMRQRLIQAMQQRLQAR